LFRIIFGRITKYFQQIHKRKTFDGDGIVCKEQKGFIKNINGCCEHSAKLNYLIADACKHKKKLYLAVLYYRDAFGFVSLQLLGINLGKIAVPKRLNNLIMDSYKNTQVRIYSTGYASEPIDIKKGVKQGCPLSLLLFDLCVDPIISYLREKVEDGYTAKYLNPATIQAYADDMILVASTEDGLQRQINRAKNFYYFVNIKLKPAKCEVLSVNGDKYDHGIVIDDVQKKYIGKDDSIKYLGVPFRSRKVSKKKFIEAKMNKIYEEMNKLEFSRLVFNQIVKTIRCFITNKMYYLFANMDISNTILESMDWRIKRVVNNFIGGQSIQRSFIYANVRNGGLEIPCMKDEYAAYKVNHIANLISTEKGKRILKGYIELK
jgi:hypothetical protein